MNLQAVCKMFVPSAMSMSEIVGNFAADFNSPNIKHLIQIIMTPLFQFTPLGTVFCLFALVGIVIFIVACWRNIKRTRHDNQNEKQ